MNFRKSKPHNSNRLIVFRHCSTFYVGKKEKPINILLKSSQQETLIQYENFLAFEMQGQDEIIFEILTHCEMNKLQFW